MSTAICCSPAARRQRFQTLAWANQQGTLLGIGLDTVSLGRASLALGDNAEASVQFDAAVTALEDAGSTNHIPCGLLARAALHRTLHNWDLAASDLTCTDEIVDRSGLKLFQVDSAIERARLTLARDGAAGITASARLVARAKALIEETRSRDWEGKERFCGQPLPGIALLVARIAILSGSPDAARLHLAEAKRWIDRGWKIHARKHAELTARLHGKDTRDDPATPAAMATRPASTGQPRRRWGGMFG